MKRILTVLLGLGLVITFTGCNNTTETAVTPKTEEPVVVQPAKAPVTEKDEQPALAQKDKTYTNKFYNFSITLPYNLEYCLNDFCQNDVNDEEIQFFKIEGTQLLKYLGIEQHKLIPSGSIEIYPRKNSLGMSAVEFAKRSLELSKQYDKRFDKKGISDEKETFFAGEKAYEFTTIWGYQERGGKLTTAHAIENAPEFFEEAGEGVSTEEPTKIVYFDHNGVMYRVVYPLYDKTAKQIVLLNFKFND